MPKVNLTRDLKNLKPPANLNRWPIKNILGQKFSDLSPLGFLGIKKSSAMWLCRCDCGSLMVTSATDLIRKHTKSCGCRTALRLKLHPPALTHGMRNTDVYHIWYSMRQRCSNPKVEDYVNYGGRGITVSPEWEDFAVFYQHVGPRPSHTHSLDRINPYGTMSQATCDGPPLNSKQAIDEILAFLPSRMKPITLQNGRDFEVLTSV